MKKLYGYRRPDGSVGFRNWVLVMPAVACVNHTAELIARDSPGVVSLHHEVGCAQIGADYRQSLMTLLNTGLHPNVGAVLLVGLGCERVDPHNLAGEIALGEMSGVLCDEDLGGTLPRCGGQENNCRDGACSSPRRVVRGAFLRASSSRRVRRSDFSSISPRTPSWATSPTRYALRRARRPVESTVVIGTEKILTPAAPARI